MPRPIASAQYYDTLKSGPRLSRARAWHVVLLLATLALCLKLFHDRRQALAPQKAPDGRVWYGPRQLRDTFDAMSEEQRSLYARSELTLDVVFPLSYGALLAIFLSWRFRGTAWGALTCLPLGAAALDLVENAINAYLAWAHPHAPWALGYVSGACSTGKWLGIAGSVLTLVLGCFAAKRRRV